MVCHHMCSLLLKKHWIYFVFRFEETGYLMIDIKIKTIENIPI